MDKVSLKEILDKIKNKDDNGYKLLYDNYFKMMYSIAYATLNNHEDSLDAVQNALVKLSKLDFDKFPMMGESSWLYSVITNEARMIKRGIKYTNELDDNYDIKEIRSLVDEYDDLDTFNSMISSLNDKQKKIVSMKILGDMKYNEIAKVLNIPIGTVQWIYNTSIKKLRLELSAIMTIVIASGINLLYRVYEYTNMPQGQMQALSDSYEKEYMIIGGVFFLVSLIILIIFIKLPKKPTKLHK